MSQHAVRFDPTHLAKVATGALLTEAAQLAGVEINQPCGGQGRCGRCAVQVTSGTVRRRSSLRLSAEDIAEGYALACQTVVEGDAAVQVPEQEKVERRLTVDRVAAEVQVPHGYHFHTQQTIHRMSLSLAPPSMDDQTDDWSRLRRALRRHSDWTDVTISLPMLRRISGVLRDGDWQVTAILDVPDWECSPTCQARLIDLRPGHVAEAAPLWGLAIDIGTTTVTVWLVDLLTGRVRAQFAEYNGQIVRGEDVVSRIIYASKNGGADEMRQKVLETINELIHRACRSITPNAAAAGAVPSAAVDPNDIVKIVVAGNSTMMHLLLGLPAVGIRLAPFVTAVNDIPRLSAADVGLAANSEATVDCLPGVASYVGADITAGVLSSGTGESEQLTLFLDVGTNGETVLGSSEWLVTCACSAGPAFEGAGVVNGMRATRGAIEEVWINGATFEPTYRVIGSAKPRGLCGSGLISLLAEMFLTGVVDKAGNIKLDLPSARLREGEHGPEYVIAWAAETAHGRDIAITHVDIDNLIRAKAAIFAGFTVLADRVGVPLEAVERVLIGGSFGKYINVEKAVQIGLLPDMPWDRFQFLGNTSVQGAYRALLCPASRKYIQEIASRMTYIELSADNSFYDAFMSALFLPHTDLAMFPSVAALLDDEE